MAISVRPVDYKFKLKIKAGEDEVELTLKQLRYNEKGHIAGLTTKNDRGNVVIDSSLTCFYNLKYAIKDVQGINNEDGTPYELRFDEDGSLADDCVDELLASAISDPLQYASLRLSDNRYPDKVIHPVTGKPIEGIEIVPASKIAGPRKKSKTELK